MRIEMPLAVAEMTVAEKLEAMEALWTDRSRNAADEALPAWHGQVLDERERRLKAGAEPVLDWEDAKRSLREESEVGGQRSEVGGQRSEVGGRRSEVRRREAGAMESETWKLKPWRKRAPRRRKTTDTRTESLP